MPNDEDKGFYFQLALVIAGGLAFGLIVGIVHGSASVGIILLTLAVCAPFAAGLFAYAWLVRRRPGRFQ